METAIKQVELLKESAEKTGLQISFEKTKFMTNIKTAPKRIKTKYGQILRTDSFKCLGEVIQQNVSDKEAINFRVKLKIAYYLTKDTYNKK